jgi:hypothetical protein
MGGIMTKYLVPCTCGKSVAVDASQAGLQIRCECGNELDVPTMRGLRQLPTAEAGPADASAQRAGAWGPRQGMMFLGGVIALIGGLVAAAVYSARPQINVQVNRAALQADNDALTLEQSWYLWQHLRQGLDQFTLTETPEFQKNHATYRLRLGLALGAVALGVLLAVAGLFVASPRSPTSAAPQRAAPR